MQAPFFLLDAFTTSLFSGNPAAVILLDHFLTDKAMLAIAAENNLSETAFLVPENDNYRLRWFTPTTEVPLCGHATLASAAVVMERLKPHCNTVIFYTASGPLTVTRDNQRYVMDFPVRFSTSVPVPAGLEEALGIIPLEVFANPFSYLVLLESEQLLRGLAPDMSKLAQMDRSGIIITAPGNGIYDFFCRYFAPLKGVPEDPVTGSAHCALAPYWASRLGKTALRSFQASKRGGEVVCRLVGDRVELEGSCVFYLEGMAEIGNMDLL
jgi:PhzF family phenazine biosynthesis protein